MLFDVREKTIKEVKLMKKIALAVMTAALSLFVLAGCSSGIAISSGENASFAVESGGEPGAGITVTAEHADADMGGTGNLTVGENEDVVIDASKLTEGKLEVKFTNEADESITSSASVSAKDSAAVSMEAGEYSVEVSPEQNTNGTATINTTPKK